MFPLLALLALPAFAAAKEEPCVYERDDKGLLVSPCINVRAGAWADFSFPLFPDGARFVYAVDGIDPDEYLVLENLTESYYDTFSRKRSTMSAFWLEYDTARLETDELLMYTEISVLYTNESTGAVGGGANGCENLIGTACMEDLRSRLLDNWNKGDIFPAERTFTQLYAEEEPHKFCPGDMLHSESSWKVIAVEAPPNVDPSEVVQESAIDPSSNASQPLGSLLYEGRDLRSHISRAAVAVLNRYPFHSGPTNEGRAMAESDVTIEFVCVQIEDDGSFDEDSQPITNDKKGDDEGAAGFLTVPNVLLSSIVSAALWIGI